LRLETWLLSPLRRIQVCLKLSISSEASCLTPRKTFRSFIIPDFATKISSGPSKEQATILESSLR
jgi:hypothetical protein